MKLQQESKNKTNTITALHSSIAVNGSIEPKEKFNGTRIDRFILVNELYKNGLPNDKEYIRILENLINKSKIELDNIINIFHKVNMYQQKNKLSDIRAFTYNFMNNYIKQRNKSELTKTRKNRNE